MIINTIKFRLLRQDETDIGRCYMYGCENSASYNVKVAAENSRFSAISRPPTIDAVNAQLNGYHRPESIVHNMNNAKGRILNVTSCEEHNSGLIDKLNEPKEHQYELKLDSAIK